ncbi:MAG: tetratricopeptide repeat protein [Anaerolineae bacterium]|nr:tetratricopeptide repeat protein [Anaerolineae bacterium]
MALQTPTSVSIAHEAIGVFANRYMLLTRIGQGGMGAVYRAEDRLTGKTVALKRVERPLSQLLLSSADLFDTTRRITGTYSPDQVALINEFRLLASLRHPNIVSVLDYGIVDGQTPFFTMELVNQPMDIADAAQQIDLQGKVKLLIDLLHALSYLHRHHIVHADLKPSNVLVDVEHRVRVVDFGLSLHANYATAVMGSLPYMAPEVLIGSAITEAADLYAFGLIAYECFTDSYPFDWSNQNVLIEQIKNLPVDMRLVQHMGNPALADILAVLLQKDPSQRYRDAASVVPLLYAAVGLEVPPETAVMRESFLQSAQFIGREVPLQLLSEALNDARNGRGSAWLIGGESGVGKSRLLEEIRIRGLVDGFQVVRAQSTDRREPNQIWRDALPILIINAQVTDIEAATLKPLVPQINDLLKREILDMPAPDSPEPGASVQDRLMRVVRALFVRQQSPVLLLLDDLHWTESSIPLLNRLIHELSDLPLLIVGTYRSDEFPAFPNQLPEMMPMLLERLSEMEVIALAKAILGESAIHSQLLDLLQSETEGNALFLIEVLRTLSEDAGALRDIGTKQLPRHVFPQGIRQVVERRLNHLSPQYLEVLRFAAVIGRVIDVQLLRHINPLLDYERWLSHCLDAAIIEIVWERWQFAHDKIREGILDGVAEPIKPFLHWRVAESIEAVYGTSAEYAAALAEHWRHTDNIKKEADYVAVVAQQLINTSAYYDARRLLLDTYARLQENVILSPNALLPSAHLKKLIGDTHSYVGQYDEAQAWYRSALKLARQIREDHLVADVSIGLGRVLALQLGNYDAAELLLVSALRIYESMGDQQGVATALFELGRIYYNCHRFEAASDYFERCLSLRYQLQDDLGVARTLECIGQIAQKHGRFQFAVQCLSEARAIHQRIGNLQGLGQTLSTLGCVAHESGDVEEGMALHQQALDIASRIGDDSLISAALNNLALLFVQAQDFQMALLYYDQTLKLARRTNNRLFLSTLLASLGLLQIELGNLKDARNNLYEWLSLVHEIGAERVLDGLLGWAKLALIEDRAVQAAEWLGLYSAHSHISNWDRNLPENDLRLNLIAKLGDAETCAVMDRGRQLNLTAEITRMLRELGA